MKRHSTVRDPLSKLFRLRQPAFQLPFGIVLLTIFVLCLCLGACQKSPPGGSIAPEMRDAYAVTSQLYGYVWNRPAFESPSSEKTIRHLLDRLLQDFHRVELKTPLQMFEPGFVVTLQTNRTTLEDIRKRFAAGSKDYANWRLRSLSESCISCHSRFNAPTDFLGAPPPPTDSSIEARLGSAQFLIATRQFDDAAGELMKIVKSVGSVESGGADAFRALELWLVIQVRVKSRYTEAAAELDKLLPSLHLASDDQESARAWIRDLKMLASRPRSNVDGITEARALLDAATGPAGANGPSELRDKRLLVRTLRASALLHLALQSLPRSDKRANATFLLAVAYVHMPIETFDLFRDLYLEQCIREFPGTKEAQDSYRLYERQLREGATGSGGVHLEADETRHLKELQDLAFGGGESESPPPTTL